MCRRERTHDGRDYGCRPVAGDEETITLVAMTAGETTICPVTDEPADLYCHVHRSGSTWPIYRASRSGHGFVRDMPDDETLAREYGSPTPRETPTPEEVRRRFGPRPDCHHLAANAAVIFDRLNNRSPTDDERRGDVLDVGAGDGVVAYHFALRGFRPTLVEYHDRPAAILDAVPPESAGGRFVKMIYEDVTLDRLGRDRPFDAIIMSQVLEHSRDPIGWLRRARTLLAPGGVLTIGVPNFGGVYRVLGRRDPFLIPPQHLHYFTPRSLRHALESTGFRVERMRSRSQLPVRATTHPSRLPRIAAVSVWNRIVAPLLNPTRLGVYLLAYATPA